MNTFISVCVWGGGREGEQAACVTRSDTFLILFQTQRSDIPPALNNGNIENRSGGVRPDLSRFGK